MTSGPQRISSRDNTLLKDLRRLSQDGAAYRKRGQVWLEGDHLCGAALARGVVPAMAVVTVSAWPAAATGLSASVRVVLVEDELFASVSALESPARMAFVVDLPQAPGIEPMAPSIVLDRVQDAGNVGSMLRSASAFGFRQVLALTGTASLWSQKVLRAGMGAHFGLRLHEGLSAGDLQGLRVPLLVTSSHRGDVLGQAVLPRPCAWAFGHEGQGVCAQVEALATGAVRIAQPGGEESLNVAAAAAICMHASMPV